MSININRAASFLATHGRVLDRRRFAVLIEQGTTENRAAVLAALDGYRNPDGGYGWGLEPDLRTSESQPAGAQHALATIADISPETSDRSAEIFDWLQSNTLPNGGLPFALPLANPAGCAPFWAQTDPTVSSLQITAAITAQAHRVARWDDQLREHPWLATATRYCFDAIREMNETPFAYVLSFALQFLDTVTDTHPEARELLYHLGQFVPSDGAIPVVGGAEGETLHLLDFAPEPGRPVRNLVDNSAVAADLDRLENGQEEDGGWTVDFTSYSAAATLEWRGVVTVGAVSILKMNGR